MADARPFFGISKSLANVRSAARKTARPERSPSHRCGVCLLVWGGNRN
jgi:hypothetical protein